MKDKFMNGMLAFSAALSNQRQLNAIKNGFTGMMAVIIVGSFCTLASNVLCSVTPGFLSVANLPGMSWLHELNPIFTGINYGTMNFMTIGLVFLIAMDIGKNYDIHDFELGVVAIGAYIALCLTSAQVACEAAEGGFHTVANVLAQNYTNANGLFVGMFVALAAGEIYCRLVKSGKLEIRLPETVPSNVARSFTVLLPAALTLFIIAGVGLIFEKITGMSIFDAIVKFVQAPVANILTGLPGFLIINLMTTILWLFGIHGNQALTAIYAPPLLAAFAENEAAYAAGLAIPNIINTPFRSAFTIITGSGLTGGLLIAIILFSKRDDYKAIAKLAIPCAIFNINEPVIFGLPVVLNPFLAIPFMLAPFVTSAFAYFMTTIGFCGRLVVNTPWTTPAGLMAFLASGGSVGAAITQILCIVIAAVIYAPFVILANHQKVEE